MNDIVTPHETIKSRLVALIQALILDSGALEDMVKSSNFKSHFKPVILGLVKQLPSMIGPMLESVSDEDLTRGLEQIRDEFIPFLLGDLSKKTEDEKLIEDRIDKNFQQALRIGRGMNEDTPSG